MAKLTVGEIAKIIQRPDETLAVAVNRLRGWNGAGIIGAIGDPHPGTGRHKRYTPLALFHAVLLQSLLNNIGGTAIEWKPVLKRISRWINEAEINPDLIVVSRKAGGEVRMNMGPSNTLQDMIKDLESDAVTVINLKRVLERLPPEAKIGKKPPPSTIGSEPETT